jgi:hypothetical protein
MPKGTATATVADEATIPAQEPVYGDLADFAEVFGEKLETIEGDRVLVRSLRLTTREVDSLAEDAQEGETEVKEVLILTVSPESQLEVEELYYTFSAPLINKMKGVSPDLFPLWARFEKRSFDGGRKQVWSIVPARKGR